VLGGQQPAVPLQRHRGREPQLVDGSGPQGVDDGHQLLGGPDRRPGQPFGDHRADLRHGGPEVLERAAQVAALGLRALAAAAGAQRALQRGRDLLRRCRHVAGSPTRASTASASSLIIRGIAARTGPTAGPAAAG
jgi:hypothetical protein